MQNSAIATDRQLPLDFVPHAPAKGRGLKGTTNVSGDGVYGWYRYIQDFTGGFAEDWISRTYKHGSVIWDPFMGSGTTLLACKKLGFESVGFDVSPFMVDVVNAKLNWSIHPDQILKDLDFVLRALAGPNEPNSEVLVAWPDYEQSIAGIDYFAGDKKLRKWMSPTVEDRFRALVAAISSVNDPDIRAFMRLAVAGVLVPASNMALRPNICYRSKALLDYPVVRDFTIRVRRMVDDLRGLDRTNKVRAITGVGDSRTAGPAKADGIFTSPPYPNDMEYVHQTRLELALLDYVSDRKGLTILKKAMISSSVKLVYRENEWQKSHGLAVRDVADVFEKLKSTLEGKDWGWNAADMTAQYFGGMRAVMRNWKMRLPPGALAAVVVGDSAFNGVKVATDTLLGACAEAEGFDVEDIAVFRSRWNTKHKETLRESVLVLRNRASA